MLVSKGFVRRRWLDFRNGHSIYLVFAMTFLNFITIQYALLVDRVPALSSIFSNLWVFAIVFISAYMPLAIIIGYWHRRNQYSVENEALLQENWPWAWIMRYQIRLIEGKVTPQERTEVMAYLEAILKRGKKIGLDADPSPANPPTNPPGKDQIV